MDLLGKTVWQQAAGDTKRDYSDVCRQWGVILSGPGYAGPWPKCADRLRKDQWSPRRVTDLERFADVMKDGDLVVLRVGTSKVTGVGQVVGDYIWCDEFGDIDGWDLQHLRRVHWLWFNADEGQQFDAYALKWGDTTQELSPEPGPVRQWLSSLNVNDESVDVALPPLPASDEDREAKIEQVSEYLFAQGVASSSISRLLDEMAELVGIANWYRNAMSGERSERQTTGPSEHETVSYLVVPLLRALGWTPQKMAIEWSNVDLALFGSLPRGDHALRVVVEAKKMDQSCREALAQAEGYASKWQGCDRIIVTDGLRYGIHTRHQGKFKLYAYMNLTRLRNYYAVYPCRGVKEALLAMTPEWRPS
jgi:hypothetical protein